MAQSTNQDVWHHSKLNGNTLYIWCWALQDKVVYYSTQHICLQDIRTLFISAGCTNRRKYVANMYPGTHAWKVISGLLHLCVTRSMQLNDHHICVRYTSVNAIRQKHISVFRWVRFTFNVQHKHKSLTMSWMDYCYDYGQFHKAFVSTLNTQRADGSAVKVFRFCI